jgi:hypothetical protein
MNFKELLEGAEPKMPGAPSGIQIMTPQQFVAKAGDEKEVDEGVRDLGYDAQSLIMKLRRDVEERRLQPTRDAVLSAARELAGDMDFAPELLVKQVLGKNVAEGQGQQLSVQQLATISDEALDNAYHYGRSTPGNSFGWQANLKSAAYAKQMIDKGVTDIEAISDAIHKGWNVTAQAFVQNPKQFDDTAKLQAAGKLEAKLQQRAELMKKNYAQLPEDEKEKDRVVARALLQALKGGQDVEEGYVPINKYKGPTSPAPEPKKEVPKNDYDYVGANAQREKERIELEKPRVPMAFNASGIDATGKLIHSGPLPNTNAAEDFLKQHGIQRFAPTTNISITGGGPVDEGLERIRKLSGLAEATKLPASSREFGGDEFQDYMKRIVGTPDKDKAGNVKLDKKGNEKYVSGKTKTDRYKMPYIHRSSVVEYVGPDGQSYSEDKIKQALGQRPKALLKQNEKMKHSNGELEQFFNVGFAALTGIALDEDTNKLIIVNTCPGAGSCKVDCFAMKGGKVQFKAAWLSDGRILTYLLNDPDGFFSQLSAEISKEEKLGQKGGYTVTIRWHDAGDFFSPEYLDLALKMAAKHPDTKFYAYTKMAGAALGAKPPNFIINWSEGANTGQEKQVKAKDASLSSTKNSRIVPDDLFQDLLVKDEKKNLVKGSSGQWQVQPDKLPELKNRLAKEYGLSANSILDYNEYMAKRKSIPAGMKYNVIVAPGEGDISANDPNIISTLLLKH